MNEPVFLTVEEVIEIQRRLVNDFGGILGIRDRGLLESAVQMPQSGFGGQYLHSSIQRMASAYLFHLVKNHPFLDGNKRIGLMTSLVFLESNGFEIDIEPKTLEEFTLSVASGKLSKNEVESFFENNAKPLVE